MIAVRVPCASPDVSIPPHEQDGFVPFETSPLAVVRMAIWRAVEKQWIEPEHRGWCIAHRPTGFNLKGREWPTRHDAMAALERCEPTFPAWALATGAEGDAATMACRVKFRAVEAIDD